MEEPVEELIFNEAADAGGEEAEAAVSSRPPGRIRKAYRARVAKPLKVSVLLSKALVEALLALTHRLAGGAGR